MNFFKLFFKYTTSKAYVKVDLDNIFEMVQKLDVHRTPKLMKKFDKHFVSMKIYSDVGYAEKLNKKRFKKGTFGHDLKWFMRSMQDDLYKKSLKKLKAKNKKEKVFFQHAMFQHDVIHFLNDYDTSPLGEVMVLSNNLANEWRWSYFVILLSSFFMSIGNYFKKTKIPLSKRWMYFHPYIFLRLVFEGYKIGKRSAWIMTVDFDNLFNKTTQEVKKDLGIEDSVYWKKIRPLWLITHKQYKIS